MEGKSLSALAASIGISLCLTCGRISAQSLPKISNTGMFLEANRFGVVKDLNNSILWLLAGYGGDVASLGGTGIGVEGLFWSRLRYLEGFRFPVEAADYYFGGYSQFQVNNVDGRMRVGHISSHTVDGAPGQTVGGSSSRFSREFAEVQGHYRFDLFGALTAMPYLDAQVGVRFLFHQVTQIEPAWQFPAAVSIPFVLSKSADAARPYLFIGTGYSPSMPSISGGVGIQIPYDERVVDVGIIQFSGPSWAGTDANLKVTSTRLQVLLRNREF